MRNFFEEIKKVIDQKTKTTPGIVANLHGVVSDVLPAPSATVTTQQWYALSIDAAKMPNLREFMDSFTFQRLPVGEATADANLTATHPLSASTGRALALYGVTHLPSSAQLPLTVTAPGQQIAVYVDATLVATGSGTLARSIPLPAGDAVVVVIAFGGTGSLAVQTDGTVAIYREDRVPAAPVPTEDPIVSYLKAGNGSYNVALSWINDPFASGWAVYRSPFKSYGVPTSVTAANGNTEMVFQFSTTFADSVRVGAPLVVNDTIVGIITSVSTTQTGDSNGDGVLTGTQITVALIPGAPTTAASYVGGMVRVSTEQYNALARVSYGGESVVTYNDTSGAESEWYSYRITAIGLLSGTTESDYTTPLIAHVLDTSVPGNITGLSVEVLNGGATASFVTPSDTDYRGVRVYFLDPVDGPQLLTQDQGTPGQADSLTFHPTVAGTYEFRTFDWAGNVQPVGVQWVWNGKGNYVSGIAPLIVAKVNTNATVDLTIEVNGDDKHFPATLEIYRDQVGTPMVLTGGGTSLPANGADTFDKTDNSALGGIALPLTNSAQWWVKVTDKDGNVRWDTTGPVRRSGIPGGVISVADYQTQPTLSLIYDENVTQIIVKKNTVAQVTLTRGSGLPAFGGGTATYAVPAIATGVSQSGWTVEYVGTGTTLVMWAGTLHGPIEAAVPPYFDYISAILDAAASDQPRYDLTVRMIDPSGLGGTLKVWLNAGASTSANPASAPDYTLAIAAANMPFTANQATAFGASGAVLNNVKGSFTLPKSIYFEFVNTNGTSTGKIEFKLAGDLGSVLNADGTLKPIGKSNFASTIKPVDIYATTPTGAQGADGDVAFVAASGRLMRKISGSWISYTATSSLEGQITGTQITDGAVDTPQLNANAVTAAKIAADSAIFGKIAAAAANFTDVVAANLTAGGIDAAKISVNQLSDFKKGDGTDAGLGIFVGGILKSVTNDSSGDPIAFLDLNATGSSPILYSTAFTLNADGNASYSGNVNADSVGAFSLTVGTYREGTTPLNLPGTLALNGVAQVRGASFQSVGLWGGTAKRLDILDDNLALYSAGNVLHALFGTYTVSPSAPGTITDSTWSVATSGVSRGSDGTTSGDAAPAINNLTAASLPANGDQYMISLTLELDTSDITAIGFTGGASYNIDGTAKVYYRTSSGGALTLLFSQGLSDSNSVGNAEAVDGVVQTRTITRTVTIPGIAASGYLDIVVVPTITYAHTGKVTGTAYLTVTGGNVTWPQVASGAVTRRGARFYAQTTGVFNPAFSIEPMTSAPVDANGRVGDVVFYAGALMVHNGTNWVSAGGSSGITQAAADARYLRLSGDTMTGAVMLASIVTPLVVSGSPTTGRQIQFGTGSVNTTFGTQYSGGDGVWAFNALQTASADSWGQYYTAANSTLARLRDAANTNIFELFWSAAGKPTGTFNSFWGSPVFSVTKDGIVNAPSFRGANGPLILARNAANTAYVDVIYLDSTDKARIPRALTVTGTMQSTNVILAGNVNPYVQFSDGTYTGYWQIASGNLNLYYNGSNRLSATSASGTQGYGQWDFLKADGSAYNLRVNSGTNVTLYVPISMGPSSDIFTNGNGVYLGAGYVGYNNEDFTARGAIVPHYGFRWTTTTDGDANVRLLGGGYGGISLFTGGAERLRIEGSGITTFYQGVTAYAIMESRGPASGVMWWARDDESNANARMMWYSSGGIARLWNGNLGDLLQLSMASGGLELTVGGVGIPNGQGYYARRTTGNALIRTMGYDAGTDDLSTVLGGSIWRIRDTGSGVPMSVTATGAVAVSGANNSFWVTDRTNSGQQYAFYATGGFGILWTANGIDAIKIAYGSGAVTFSTTITVAGDVVVGANVKIASQYESSLVGLYDPNRIRGIYAMGDIYKLGAGGTTLGNLYGLFFTYDHTSYVNLSGYSLGHGFGLAAGGVAKFYCGESGMWHAATIRASDFILTSDIRLKTDLTRITSALDKVGQLNGWTYTLKADESKRVRAGLIAQELLAAGMTELVYENADGMLSVAYDQAVPYLLEAIKELHEKVKRLEAR